MLDLDPRGRAGGPRRGRRLRKPGPPRHEQPVWVRGQGAEQRPFSHEAVADAFPKRPMDPHVGDLLFHRRPIRLPRARDGVAVPIDFGTLRQVSVEVIKAMKKRSPKGAGASTTTSSRKWWARPPLPPEPSAGQPSAPPLTPRGPRRPIPARASVHRPLFEES